MKLLFQVNSLGFFVFFSFVESFRTHLMGISSEQFLLLSSRGVKDEKGMVSLVWIKRAESKWKHIYV